MAPGHEEAPPSGNQVRKAGRVVRAYLTGEGCCSQEDYEAAIVVIEAHRAAHQKPLKTANVALRGMCKRMGIPVRVTSRLKRMETIKEKLTDRETLMDLDRMQDIGGCRVVVPDIQAAYELARRIMKSHPDGRQTDYIREPRSSGYRAIHIITKYGGQPRKTIEVQIRTPLMHQWADTVERTSGALGVNYKHDGDTRFHRLTRLLAEILRLQELGLPVGEDLIDTYNQAIAEALDDPAIARGDTAN